jgi:hypothetical protein
LSRVLGAAANTRRGDITGDREVWVSQSVWQVRDELWEVVEE